MAWYGHLLSMWETPRIYKEFSETSMMWQDWIAPITNASPSSYAVLGLMMMVSWAGLIVYQFSHLPVAIKNAPNVRQRLDSMWQSISRKANPAKAWRRENKVLSLQELCGQEGGVDIDRMTDHTSRVITEKHNGKIRLMVSGRVTKIVSRRWITDENVRVEMDIRKVYNPSDAQKMLNVLHRRSYGI